jgi:transcription antitermination protein NusB
VDAEGAGAATAAAGRPPHPHHFARRVALDLLYQADVMGVPPADAVARSEDLGIEVPPFARELVVGVGEHLEELDRLIAAHSDEWTVERMAVVDRNVLRLACYELAHRPDVPPGAAIAEAVEAAKELSTAESGRFVNGILGRIAREGGGEGAPAG